MGRSAELADRFGRRCPASLIRIPGSQQAGCGHGSRASDGVDIKALSEYLGHHDPGFTLRIYVHLMPDAADRMRSVIDKALSPGADGPSTAQEAIE